MIFLWYQYFSKIDQKKLKAKKPNITLRDATIADLPLLEYWDEQPHVIAADPDDDWDWEYELQHFPTWREQLVAELDGQAIGFIQIIDPAEETSHYWGAVATNLRAIDIWIGAAANLGKGYGTIMMTLALARCFKNEAVTAVIIDPLETNKKAIRFYERMAFKLVERRQFGTSHCLVHQLDRKTWQRLFMHSF